MNDERKLLISGLESLKLPVDEKKVSTLLAFVNLIDKWNKAYNLTAIRNRQDMIRLHILDSLTAISALSGPRVIDIGTGAGLPGIPLALFKTDFSFTLLDSNAKKTRFVRQVLLELKISNVEVVHYRVENFKPDLLFNTVICRAFSGVQEIISHVEHLIEKQGIVLAMKGQIPERQLSVEGWQFTVVPVKVPGIEAERCLVTGSRATD